MTEKITMRELRNRLNDLIEQGYGDKIVEVTSETTSNHTLKTSLKLKRNNDDKSCGRCKHLQIDGMFGMWCDKEHNWKNIANGHCNDWER